MSTISATDNTSNYAQVNNSTAVNPGTSEDSQQSDSEVTDNIALSSRASKIQKLNEEFFPGGPKTVTITPEFIQRLSEYGLISEDEAQKLNSSASSEDTDLKPLEQVSNFIDVLSEKIKQQDPQSTLLETLQKAKTVIDGFGIDAAAMNSDIKSILAELHQFNQSEQGLALSDEDKKSMEQLDLALKIADQMNPLNASSQQVGSYVAVFNQALEWWGYK